MSVIKSGSKSVSLKSSARPEAMSSAQCWSLGVKPSTRSGSLKERTCCRMTSGWKSGLDSTAIASDKNQATPERTPRVGNRRILLPAFQRCGKVLEEIGGHFFGGGFDHARAHRGNQS